MSCLDKCHVTHGGGMQGHYKYTDGFSDTSSVGSFMDDTDREVSSLTDRAFKSLCIGDEAVYNDSEFASSPTERYDAFSLDSQNTDILRFNGHKVLSLGRKQNGGGVAGAGEATVGATFQQSVLDMARKGLKNGAIETAWQQSKALVSSGGGTTAENFQGGQVRAIKDFKYKNNSNDLWENSALLNIRGELSDSAGHDSGHFKQTKNHFHSSRDAMGQTSKKDPEKTPGKPSKSKRGKSSKPRKPSNKNFFLHSEDSPFESWRDSNRILFEQNHTAVPVSTNQRPMWYDSPLYKELTAEHGLQIPVPKESEPSQTKSEGATVSPAPPPSMAPPSTPPAAPPSSVALQKATAFEKRSESESSACLPPWRQSRAQTTATLPWSRPSTAVSYGEREGQSLVGVASVGRANGMVAAARVATVAPPVTPVTSVSVVTPMTSVTVVTPITSITVVTPITSVTAVTPVTTVKAVTMVDEPASSSSTPFSISQLLTPIINARQGTGTSEVLRSTLSPSSLDLDLSPSSFTDASAKLLNEVKSRNSYKAIASGLLFNLKDNRKRVKSTYSPTKFKMTDFSKQPSKPETAEPKNATAISEAPVAEDNASLQPKVSNVRPASEVALESTAAQTVDHKKPADGGISDDYLTLSSPHTVKEAAASRNFSRALENIPGKIQLAESGNGQCHGSEQPKSDRTQLWEKQGISHPALNLYNTTSVTEAIVPAIDVSSPAFNDKESGIKEALPLRGREKSAKVKHNEIRTVDNYHDGGDRHNDRRDMHVSKRNDKSRKKQVLSVKERVELVEKRCNKNQFAAQKNNGIKQGAYANSDKHHTKERENTKQRLTPVQETERDRKEGCINHIFSAQQNQYIKNERHTTKDHKSDQADNEKDATVTGYNRPVFTSEDLENTERQNVEKGDFSTRHRYVAGDLGALKSHEGLVLRRDSEFARNEFFANDVNVNAQQEVPEEVVVESEGRLHRSEDVLPDTEGSQRVLYTRQDSLKTRAPSASTEFLQPMQGTPLIKGSPVENDENVENQHDKKEALEDVYEISGEKTSRNSTENAMHFIREKNKVKMGSPAETDKPLSTLDRFAILERDEKESLGGIKVNQTSENNVFANYENAAIKHEAPRREHSKSDTFAETEKESSDMRDSRSKGQTEQEEGGDSEQTSAGVNETEQNEQENCTFIQDLQRTGKSDSVPLSKEKDSKIKQICKLKDKVMDVFSMREHKARGDLAENQDKLQAKQEATQKQEEDHKQLLTSSNMETNKVNHGGFDIILEESIETEKEYPSEIPDSREAVTKDITEQAISKQADTVRHKRRSAPPVPTKPDLRTEGQPSHPDVHGKSSADAHLSAEKTKTKTLEHEMQAHPALGNAEGRGEESEEIRNNMAPTIKDQAEVSPLLYYAINDDESEMNSGLPASPLRESTPCKVGSTTSLNDLDEGGWVRCLIEYAKSQASGPRSNTSSPSTIRHTLFKVKDNTVLRASPLTKVIRSPLHKPFPEDFRLNSPRDSWSGSEKGEDERGRLRERSRAHSPREASVSRRGARLRGTPARSPMAQATVTPVAQEHGGPQCSPQTAALTLPGQDREEGHMTVRALSGEVESSATNAMDVVEEKVPSSLHVEEPEGSKEPSEKSESVCSAGEVQPLGKPPPVLPKSEKALRRAKRLTNRRIRKAEAEGKREGKSRARSNPARERRTEPPPAPPEIPPLQPAHNPSPEPEPEFCPEPAPSQLAPNTVTQSFPVTQRKLLQDPDSGQYFMVDMPVQVQTKMFFDPETGKYIQLPVQAPEVVSSRPPSMEILNAPYLLYPGFVPVPVSEWPPQGSASQTPASETQMENKETLQSRSAPCRQEDCQQTQSNEAETYIESARVPFECFPEEPLYMEDADSINSRNMSAVSASDLDSFALDYV